MNINLVIFNLLLILSTSYLELESKSEMSRLFDAFPQKPAFVIYETTTQNIQQHQSIYQKLHTSTKDYCLVLIINCQKNVKKQKKQQFDGCPGVLKHQRQLVVIEGYTPNSNMLSIRGKMFRMVPGYIQNEVQRSFETLFDIAEGLIPNSVQKLYSEEDIKSFLQKGSYLVPRVFIYTDSEEYISIKKLSVYFNDRARFAEVLVKQYSETKMVVYNFNFNQKAWNQHTFPSKIGIKEYQNMKKFIEEYASQKPIRQEYDYLKIGSSKINYADKNNYTQSLYQNIEKYTLVFKGQNRELGQKVLSMYKQKYGQFLNYILYLTWGDNVVYLTLDDTKLLPLEKPQLSHFPTYRFQDIEKNAQNLMDLGNIVFLVEPNLDYLCSIQHLKVVSGFLNCYAVNQQDIEIVKSKFDIPKADQMAILFSTNKEDKFVGKNLNNFTFQNVISITYNIVRARIKALAKKFSNNPIFPILQDTPYHKICQNCFLFLHSHNPNSITLENYKAQAIQHNKQMPFYFGFHECNKNLFKQLKKQPQDMLMFISKRKVFYTKQIIKNTAGKIIKKWEQGGLKMKALNQQLKSDDKCSHNDQWKKNEENDQL